MVFRLTLMASILIFSSCSSFHKLGVRSATGVLKTAAKEMETESNWYLFKDAVPASLKTLEGLLFVDPTNKVLLLSLLKGHTIYGFGVGETLYLEDNYVNNQSTLNKEQAVAFYARAVQYGMRLLAELGISYDDIIKASKSTTHNISSLLDQELNPENVMDKEAVFFTAQSWGGLINLQRSDFFLMSQLGVVKDLFDWSCRHDPNINFGSCQVFYGTYETGRPKMLGGNMEKGIAHFQDGIKNHPDNLLIRTAYLQSYVIPAMDEKEYSVQKEFLTKKFSQLDKVWNHGPNGELNIKKSNLNLINAIARKRFEAIVKNEDEIF